MTARLLACSALVALLSTTGCTGWILCVVNPQLSDACSDIVPPGPEVPGPGQLVGTVTLDGNPVPAARINFLNLPRTLYAGDDGRFVITDVPEHPVFLSIRADQDGDGIDDAGALLSASLVQEPHATANFGTENRLGGYDFGEVALESLRRVEGTVNLPGGQTPAEAGVTVRVFAHRPACTAFGATSAGAVDARCPEEERTDYVADSDGDVVARDLSVETISGVAENGTFTLRGVLPGAVNVVAVVTTAGDLSDVLAVSEAVLHESGGVTITFDDLVAGGTSRSFVRLSQEVRDDPYALLFPPSSPRPPCGDQVPDLSGYPGAQSLTLTPGDTPAVDAPVGVFDVVVCEGGENSGVLFRQVFAPGAVASRVLGPMSITPGDALCPVIGEGSDCDGDGLVALPPLVGVADYLTARDLFERCATDCAGDYGADTMFGAGQVDSCVDDALVYDCNDDGDNQPDTTEAKECLAPGAGNDLDGDLLCDGQDPFPWCTSNDPAECGAVTNLPPAIPAEYLELPFCLTYDVEATDYCTLRADAVDCAGDYAVSCAEQECFVDGQCEPGDSCEDIAGTLRCRTPCPVGDECDVGETCTNDLCEPDVPQGPVMRCTCEIVADLPNSPDFVDVPANPGDTCDPTEQEILWQACRALWNPAD